jgi:hypothetical protein
VQKQGFVVSKAGKEAGQGVGRRAQQRVILEVENVVNGSGNVGGVGRAECGLRGGRGRGKQGSEELLQQEGLARGALPCRLEVPSDSHISLGVECWEGAEEVERRLIKILAVGQVHTDYQSGAAN